LAFELPIFNNAVRGWFAEIRQQDRAHAYKRFARNIVSSDDYIITFNYDVSLDRELRLAGKLEIGDGYGFPIENFPVDSPVKMLKLHGSVSWLALMFSAIQSGNVFGLRPVIGRDDLETLVYPDAIDPKFVGDVFAHPVMIMPTRSKEFFFTVDTAAEYTEFWHEVWRQASVALQASDRIVICGYGMSSADQQARKLLLEAPRKDAEIVVASGDDTCRIVREYQEADYTRAKPAEEVMFEKWVDSCTIAAVA
jgi:hypothetical protein